LEIQKLYIEIIKRYQCTKMFEPAGSAERFLLDWTGICKEKDYTIALATCVAIEVILPSSCFPWMCFYPLLSACLSFLYPFFFLSLVSPFSWVFFCPLLLVIFILVCHFIGEWKETITDFNPKSNPRTSSYNYYCHTQHRGNIKKFNIKELILTFCSLIWKDLA